MTSHQKLASYGLTIGECLKKLAAENPDKPAFIFWDKFEKRLLWTRQDIWIKSLKCASFLRRNGVKKGDVVCNTLVPSPESLILMYGTVLAGGVAMHGQKFLADGSDLIKNLKDTKAKCVAVDEKEKRGAATILENIQSKDSSGNDVYEHLPSLSWICRIKMGDNSSPWIKELDQEPEIYHDETVTFDDIVSIFATSGTTGFAKMIPYSHRGIFAHASIESEFITISDGDCKYLNYRAFGWNGGYPRRYPYLGITRICIDFTPGKSDQIGDLILKMIDVEKVDSCLVVPMDMLSILQAHRSREGKDFHKLKEIITGGAPTSNEHMKVMETLAEAAVVVYAGTEFGAAAFEKTFDVTNYESNRVGFPVKNKRVKILDEQRKEVQAGITGEIYVRSDTLGKGYMNLEKETKQAFLPDNWFRTSDIGKFDQEGRLYVYCRKSNVIQHKGFIHYPGWMEASINKHPNIKKSVVVGIPHPTNCEDICVCIIQTPGSNLTREQVIDYTRSLYLTTEQQAITPIPEYVFFMETFPVNSNGKVDRKVLKANVLENIKAEDPRL